MVFLTASRRKRTYYIYEIVTSGFDGGSGPWPRGLAIAMSGWLVGLNIDDGVGGFCI